MALPTRYIVSVEFTVEAHNSEYEAEAKVEAAFPELENSPFPYEIKTRLAPDQYI